MSTPEKILKDFLNKNKISYRYQEKIDNVPWNMSNTHKVDFYIPSKKLLIEVKGFMTLYSINQLKWECEKLPQKGYDFFIFQATEQDWLSQFNQNRDRSINGKITQNIDIQLQDLLKNKKFHILTKKRLNDYIKIRKQELKNWMNLT